MVWAVDAQCRRASHKLPREPSPPDTLNVKCATTLGRTDVWAVHKASGGLVGIGVFAHQEAVVRIPHVLPLVASVGVGVRRHSSSTIAKLRAAP